MLLLEDTIYRNIFNKNSFQRIIIETIEMYHSGLINNTEIYTMKSQRLPTYSENGHKIIFNVTFTIIFNSFLFDCCIYVSCSFLQFKSKVLLFLGECFSFFCSMLTDPIFADRVKSARSALYFLILRM